jgi:hypothetical protein
MADKRISQLVERTDIANNDVVPIVASGATTTNKATISSIQEFMQENLDLGVTSVGITLGSTGTDVSVSGSPITTSGNITINLPTASATNRGLLSAADWTTFNNKQAAGNYVTLDTAQTITAQKTFTTSGSSDTMIISHGSGSGFALDVIKAGNGETLRVTKTSGSGNAMSVIGGVLSTEGISSTAPSNAISLLLNGRSADNVGIIAFGANTGGGQYNFIQASPTSLIVGSRGNTPLEFHTNVNGGGGPRMTIAGSGGVTFTNGITTTSAVLTSVLQGVNANFSGLIETSDSLRIGTTASVKHNSTIFTLNGYNNIQGNINSFAVYNGTKGMRINFPSNESFTHTLPDASGTLALTTDLGAYLPLTGGTLTGALNGTSASFSGDLVASSNIYSGGSTSLITSTGVLAGSEVIQIFNGGAASSNIDKIADLILANNNSFTDGTIGRIIGVNNNLATAEKRIAQISMFLNGATNSGAISFSTMNSGTLSSKMTITSAGNVGIGTASPTSIGTYYTSLEVKGKSGGTGNEGGYYLTTDADGSTVGQFGVDGNFVYLGSRSNTDAVFTTNNTERMRITSGGELLINATSNSASSDDGSKFVSNGRMFQVSSFSDNTQESLSMYSTTASAYRFYVGWGGTIFATSPIISTISDVRVKENIRDLDSGLDKIMLLKPRIFDWKEGKGKDIKNDRGFIAQEFEEVFPDLIDIYKQELEEGEEPYKSVRADLIPTLVKAIQELKTEIDSLKNQINQL